jgi:hypothetical protein
MYNETPRKYLHSSHNAAKRKCIQNTQDTNDWAHILFMSCRETFLATYPQFVWGRSGDVLTKQPTGPSLAFLIAAVDRCHSLVTSEQSPCPINGPIWQPTAPEGSGKKPSSFVSTAIVPHWSGKTIGQLKAPKNLSKISPLQQFAKRSITHKLIVNSILCNNNCNACGSFKQYWLQLKRNPPSNTPKITCVSGQQKKKAQGS